MTKKKQKSHGESPNEICKGCLKWEKNGRNCSVFWEGKKWCTLKVTSVYDLKKERRMLRRAGRH